MDRAVLKIDERFNRMLLRCQSHAELAEWSRTLMLPATHRLSIRLINDPPAEARLGKPGGAPMVFDLCPEPLPLDEIAIRTNRFGDLSIVELRWLAKEHGVTLPDKPQPGVKDDKTAIIVELLKLIDAAKDAEDSPESPAAPPRREQLVIPSDVREWDDATLDTRAAELGVSQGVKGWRKIARHIKEEAVTQALAALAASEQPEAKS